VPAQRLLSLLSPQRKNLFDYETACIFSQAAAHYINYYSYLGENNGSSAIVNSHRPLSGCVSGVAFYF
jgi:hypothetical protein